MALSIVVILLAALFMILNILDIVTTRKALALGAREINPLARFLMKRRLFLPVKCIVALLIVWIMFSQETEGAVLTGTLCCLVYIFVVINNIRAIHIQKGRF